MQILSWPKPIFSTTIFHSLLKSMSWRHLARDFRASHHHYCYCSMPTSLIWCQMCLGLCFWVWISIYGFRSLFLGLGLCLCLGLCVKRQGNVWQTPTNSATTIDDATTGGHWSLSSFFVLVFFFPLSLSLSSSSSSSSSSFGLGLGQFTDWVFLCDIWIWLFFIWVWKGVWVWPFADLWVFFDLGFVSKWL